MRLNSHRVPLSHVLPHQRLLKRVDAASPAPTK